MAIAPLPGRPKLIHNKSGLPSSAQRYRIGRLMSVREVKDALSGPDGELWKNAMKKEIESLNEKKTWYLVKHPPKAKVVKNRWVLTRKEDGTFKARLVAKGFTQKFGIDYLETFSPVIRSSSVRLLLSHAHASKMHIHHVDVKSAYLNSPIDETIYMEQPYMFDDGGDRVCLLEKSIYGLKQAAKCWHDKLIEVLSSLGLSQLKTEPCIATSRDFGLIVGFYVDDLIILSHDLEAIRTFKSKVGEIVKITDKGEISTFVGLEIRRTNDSLRISQPKYTQSLLERHQMELSNSEPTPFPLGTVMTPEDSDPLLTNINEYQSMVGELMYLANMTRPDISFAVGQLSRYMNQPRSTHLKVAKHVLRYLQGTKYVELVYRGQKEEMAAFSDSDYANGVDSKSISGWMFFHRSDLVSWQCQKQTTVSTSTTEAEVTAMKSLSSECVYMFELAQELRLMKPMAPVKIFCDNQAACKTVESGGSFQRTKHYRTRINFVKDCIKRKIVSVFQIGTEEMLADGLTKPLSKHRIKKLFFTSGAYLDSGGVFESGA